MSTQPIHIALRKTCSVLNELREAPSMKECFYPLLDREIDALNIQIEMAITLQKELDNYRRIFGKAMKMADEAQAKEAKAGGKLQ